MGHFVKLSQNIHPQVDRDHPLGEILGFVKTLINLIRLKLNQEFYLNTRV